MKHKHSPRFGRLAASVLLLLSLTGIWVEPARGQAVLKKPVINGTNVTLEWSSTISSGALEIGPTVNGPWTVISDATAFVSNRVVTPLGLPARFFRVKNNGVPGPACPVLPESLAEEPVITFASIQKLPSPTSEGNTRLNVRFMTNTIPTTFSNVVPVLLENRVMLLRDDGQGADTNANDGLFGGVIEVNPAELEAANSRLAARPPSQRLTQQFVERRRVGSDITINAFPITNFNLGQPVTLLTENAFGPLKINCPAGSPTAYLKDRTMMITALPVVADSTRTWEPCNWPIGVGTKMGKWSFGRLMSDMCNQPMSGVKPGVFMRNWLRHWEVNQSINFFNVPNIASQIQTKVINPWAAQSLLNGFPPGELDVSIAPFRLCAIVNRLDLRPNGGFSYSSSGPANAGEARFVFCAVSTDGLCNDLRFLVILEYGVPKSGCAAVKAWAVQWAGLNGMTPGSAAFNAALEAITDQFAGPNTDPSKGPNKSAINQIRSNEILANQWVMREWVLKPVNASSPGELLEVTTKNTPDLGFDNTATINSFLPAGLAPTTVPPFFLGNPFLSGSAPMPLSSASSYFTWDGSPTMAINPKLPPAFAVSIRHAFALNTCNGCHLAETKATVPSGNIPIPAGPPIGLGTFAHVDCRPHPNTFATADLSDFLTGANMPKRDPLDPAVTYSFADLDRRVADMDEVINCPCSPFGVIFNQLAIGRAKFHH